MGAFAPSVGPSSEPQQRTGFCAYSQKYIDKLFDQNIHMCFNGSMQYRNLPYISGIIGIHLSFYTDPYFKTPLKFLIFCQFQIFSIFSLIFGTTQKSRQHFFWHICRFPFFFFLLKL